MVRIKYNALKKQEEELVIKTVVWNVAIYARLSKEDEREEEERDSSLSIANQETAGRRVLSKHNDMRLYDVYVDDGFSGGSLDRPDLKRLFKDIQEGKVNCVIIKNFARLSRDDLDILNLIKKDFPEKGVRLISMIQPKLDTFLEPKKIDSEEVKSYCNSNSSYLTQTSENILMTQEELKMSGQFIGAFAPYGLKKKPREKRKLVIDGTAAFVVKMIFDMAFYEGLGSTTIAKILNEYKIPPPGMYKRLNGSNYKNKYYKDESKTIYWSAKAIKKILTDEMYIGNMVQSKSYIKEINGKKRFKTDEEDLIIVEGTHEPIIEKHVFYGVQEMLKRDTKVPAVYGKKHLMSGYTFCGKCGYAMKRSVSKNHKYYICSTHTNQSKNLCKRNSIKEDDLIKACFSYITRQIKMINDFRVKVENINLELQPEKKSEKLNVEEENALFELDKLKTARSQNYVDYQTNKHDYDFYSTTNLYLDKVIGDKVKEIEEIRGKKAMLDECLSSNNNYFRTYQKYINANELTKEIMSDLVDKVIVDDKSIKVIFRMRDYELLIEEYIRSNSELVRTRRR